MAAFEEISALKLYLQVFWRRRWIFAVTLSVVMAMVILYTLTSQKVYESSMLLLISGKEKAPQVILDETLGNPTPSDDLDTEVQVLQTLPVLSSAVKNLKKTYPELEANTVSENLMISQIGKSGIVSIAYQDTDPKRLLAVLDQLGQTYVDFGLTSRKSRVTSAIRFIERTLPQARKNLSIRTAALEQFRRQHNLLDPDLLGKSLGQALAELGQQERVVSVKIRESQALYQTLKNRSGLLPNQALTAASLSQDPIYSDLLRQYQEAQNLYSIEQLRFKDTTPQLQALKARRDRLQQLLNTQVQQIVGKNTNVGPRLNTLQITQVGQFLEAENSLKVAQASASALTASRQRLEQEFKLVPALQRTYEDLDRQVKVAADSVNRLLTKWEEFRISEAQESAPWVIIQPPYLVGRPVSPNTSLNVLVGGFLALLAGGAAVYLREQLDNRVRSVRNVRELLGIPILASLPRTEQVLLDRFVLPELNLATDTQAKRFYEAVQFLNFNIRESCTDEGLQIVVGFTSPTSRNGKSTTLRHLGFCAQEWGLRVLLIDADLRRPTLHKALGLTNTVGLSSVISQNLPWEAAIQHSHNLDILTSGPLPAQVLPILDSPKLHQLFLSLRDQYDLILVDLPPMVATNDPLLVSPHLDGLVVVVGVNQATSHDLIACREALSQVQTKILGLVCTMIDPHDMPYAAYIQEGQPQSLTRQLLARLPNR